MQALQRLNDVFMVDGPMCLNVVVAIHSKATAMHTDEPAVLEAFENL